MDSPRLIETQRGITLEYRSKYLYSKHNPLRVLSIVENTILQENTVYLLPSPLLFYGVDKLHEKLPKSSLIIPIEYDESLYKLSLDYGKLYFVKTGFDFFKILNEIDYSKYRNCKILSLNNGYNLYKEAYDKLLNILLSSLQNYWKNKITCVKLGQLWTKNTINNISYIKDSKPLSALKTNKTVLVVGAGESLEKSLGFINDNRDKLFILCVDTALQTLLEVNVIPDLVLALEGQFYNLPDFYGTGNRKLDIIYDISSYTGVVEKMKGNKYFVLTKYSESSLLAQISKLTGEPLLPPLGSVGITALYIALRLTNSKILTTGLDFSYQYGKSHSRGTPYHLTNISTNTRIKPLYDYRSCLLRPLQKVENKNNSLELTDSILFEYSLRAKELLLGENRIFDITNRGMDLGIPLVEPESIKFEDNNFNIDSIIYFSDLTSLKVNIKNSINLAIELIKNLLSGTNNLMEIKEQLNKLDFLFIHFPESKPLEKLSGDNILRYYYSLIRYKRILR